MVTTRRQEAASQNGTTMEKPKSQTQAKPKSTGKRQPAKKTKQAKVEEQKVEVGTKREVEETTAGEEKEGEKEAEPPTKKVKVDHVEHKADDKAEAGHPAEHMYQTGECI